MLIQRQNISFKGFKVDESAKPYINNALPGVIGFDENFLTHEPLNILTAFKKRMDAFASPIEKKKKLDVVLTTVDDVPCLILRDKKGNTKNQLMVVRQLIAPEGRTPCSIHSTAEASRLNFNDILTSAYVWLTDSNKISIKHQERILPQEVYANPTHSNPAQSTDEAAPSKLSEAIKKVFG